MKKSWLFGEITRKKKISINETNIVAGFIDKIPTSKTIVNVGAHKGSNLDYFIENDWNIYAFEPDIANRSILEKKYGDKINIDSRAVSNTSSKSKQFYTSNQSSGISGLLAFHESHKESYFVDVVTLKEFCEQNNINNIDCLIIDTEGYDLPVIKGLDWEKICPEILLCEFEDNKTLNLNYSFHDLAKFIMNKNYIVYVSEWYPIEQYGIKHDWRGMKKYPCELKDTNAWGNLIAFKDNIDEKVMVKLIKNEIYKNNLLYKYILFLINLIK